MRITAFRYSPSLHCGYLLGGEGFVGRYRLKRYDIILSHGNICRSIQQLDTLGKNGKR